MEKPYDLKALGERILEKAKADGLTVAEEAVEKLAKASLKAVQEWLQESAALTGTPIDDIAVKVLALAVFSKVEGLIEKIDLDQNGA